jgi:4a-hydroxytetrahydrobiopterin dehydratase
MSVLAAEILTRCPKDSAPLAVNDCAALLEHIPDWTLVEVKRGVLALEHSYTFPDFAAALRFTNAIGILAEAADHHPSVLTEWGKVRVQWWTHTVNGLHRNDFIMAARTSALLVA